MAVHLLKSLAPTRKLKMLWPPTIALINAWMSAAFALPNSLSRRGEASRLNATTDDEVAEWAGVRALCYPPIIALMKS